MSKAESGLKIIRLHEYKELRLQRKRLIRLLITILAIVGPRGFMDYLQEPCAWFKLSD